ncbi:hypothetical protein SC1_04316 [Sphingopyxis sp. C-1]|nr:hypothetical protein SC1_04316 [Sphingopyxis sp. C-1]
MVSFAPVPIDQGRVDQQVDIILRTACLSLVDMSHSQLADCTQTPSH